MPSVKVSIIIIVNVSFFFFNNYLFIFLNQLENTNFHFSYLRLCLLPTNLKEYIAL